MSDEQVRDDASALVARECGWPVEKVKTAYEAYVDLNGLYDEAPIAIAVRETALKLTARDRVRELTELLANLIDALDACKEHIDGAFMFASIHGQDYKGPTYGVQLETARAALANAKDAP